MKKWLAIALCICLVISLTACSQRNDVKEPTTPQSQYDNTPESDDNSTVDSNISNEPASKPASNTEDETPSPEPEQSKPNEIKFVDIYDNFAFDSENNLYVIQNVGELGPKHTLLLENVSHFAENTGGNTPNIQTADGRFWRVEYGQESWEITEYKTNFPNPYTLVSGKTLLDEYGNYYAADWQWSSDEECMLVLEDQLVNLHLNLSKVKAVYTLSSQQIVYLTNENELYLRLNNKFEHHISSNVQKAYVAEDRYTGSIIWVLTNDNTLSYYVDSYMDSDITSFSEWKKLANVDDIYPQYTDPIIKMRDGSYIRFYSLISENYPQVPEYEIPYGFSEIVKIAMPDAIVGARDEYGYPATMKCMVILTTDGRIAVLLPAH